YLFCLKATRYRSTSVGTELGVEAIYIKTDVYFFRKFAYNLVNNIFPACSLVYLRFDITIKKCFHSRVIIYNLKLFVAIIADTQLYQCTHLWYLLQYIVHNRGM